MAASASPSIIDFAVARVFHGEKLIDQLDLVENSDPRLSDAREPTAHTHLVADVTDVETIFDRILTNGTDVLVGNGNVLWRA